MQQLTREGPSTDEIQIIGVELAVAPPGQVEVELEMFACRHTLPSQGCYYGGSQIRVTLHTSRGDITLRGQDSRL